MVTRLLLTLGAVVTGLLLIATTEAKRPAHAGPPATYAFSLDQAEPVPAGTKVTFTVTRDRAGTDSDDVLWVSLECDGYPAKFDQPVIWGFHTNLVGRANMGPVFGSACTAWLTETPWRYRHHDPSIAFAVQ